MPEDGSRAFSAEVAAGSARESAAQQSRGDVPRSNGVGHGSTLSSASRHSARAGRIASRFAGDARGAVAVEWAAVAVPFFAILGAIFDISLTGWVSQNLNNAVNDAARTIQTGSFQGANHATKNTTELLNKFREKVCMPDGHVRLLFVDCNNVKVQVQTFASMGQSQSDSPINPATGDWASGFGTKYTSPAGSTIVVVQAAVKYPVWMNILNVTPTFADGSRLIQSTVVFKTEPFGQ